MDDKYTQCLFQNQPQLAQSQDGQTTSSIRLSFIMHIMKLPHIIQRLLGKIKEPPTPETMPFLPMLAKIDEDLKKHNIS